MIINIQKPCYRTIDINGVFWRLPFPYVVFNETNIGLFVGFCNTYPEKYCGSRIFLPPLPNIYETYKVCLPHYYQKPNLINLFWQSSFSLAHWCFFAYSYACIETEWEKYRRLQVLSPSLRSKEIFSIFDNYFNSWKAKNLEDITKVNWRGGSVTLEDFESIRMYK